MELTEFNKEVVRRFNKIVVEGDEAAFLEIMHVDFINKTAALVNIPSGADGVWHTFNNVLRPALSNFRIEIYDQVAEGDKVTTRKAIMGTHTGQWFDVAPTNRQVRIDVIDIVTVRDGKYYEHWGVNTLQAVLASLRKSE